MSLSRGLGLSRDGLALVEDLCLVTVEACMPPTVSVPKPGPCPGGKRGVGGVAKSAKSVVKKTRTSLTEKIPKKTAVAKAPAAVAKAVGGRKAEKAPSKITSAEDLFAPSGQKVPKRVPEAVLASLREAYETEHEGLSSRIKSAGSDESHVTIFGEILGPGDKSVGTFTWKLNKGSDEVTAYLDLLLIDKEFQGQGFARKFNNQAFEWYRQHGVSEAGLQANVDVGAYAWARANFDWMAPEDAGKIKNRLREMAGGKDKKAARLASKMLDRFATTKFGTPEYPTPLQVSELGRPKGAGKDGMWPGKHLFRSPPEDRLSWDAKLRFPPQQVTAAAGAAGSDRVAMMWEGAQIHDQWVARNLKTTKFVASPDSPDYNLYYVDLDASGEEQDNLAAAMARVTPRA